MPAGELREVEIGENIFAVCNVNGEMRALSGVCPHQGGPLGEGALDGELIVCPWHAWEFHSGTGVCRFNSAVSVPVYPVKVEGGSILVDIPVKIA